MQVLDLIRQGRLRTAGSLCAALALLVFATGCPFAPQPPSCTAESCDDGVFCNGVETCGDDGRCDPGTAPCDEAAGETCNEEADRCDVCADAADCDDMDDCTTDACTDGQCSNTAIEGCCNDDADCDDGDACTDDTCVDSACVNTERDCDDGDACTTDTCDDVTGCANTPIECPVDQECVDGACVGIACTVDGDCDDGDACTENTCADGFCATTDTDCDDGDACTTDTCDAATGCVNTPIECPDGQSCVNGACVDACVDDADCDDGLFCNGAEVCVDNACVAGTDPCGGLDCDETTDSCDAETFQLTLGQDGPAGFIGGAGDDIFNAPLIFNAPNGQNLPSLQSQDNLAGGGGTDILNATVNFTAATTLAPTISGIEIFNFTDFGSGAATTVNGTNISGVTDINIVSSISDTAMIFNNLGSLADAGIANSGVGLSLSFLSAATSGSTDAMTLTLSNMSAGEFAVTTGNTNGVETLNIVSAGSANTLTTLTQTTGTTMSTLNVSGTQNLTITNALPNTITTIDASEFAGNFSASAGTGAVAFTGGSGDDTAIFGANYTTADTIDGGEGANTLSITTGVAAPATAQSNVTNIQALTISDAHTTAPVLSRWGTIDTLNLPLGSNGGSATVSSGSTVNFGARAANNDSAGAFTAIISGSGTTDVLNLVYNDSDTAGAVTLTGVETANLMSNIDLDGSAADGDANTFAAFTMPDATGVTLNISGTEAVTFGGAVTARTINATDFAHNVTMTLNASNATTTSTVATGGALITGGTGDDVLVGSISGDTINSGAGNNAVQPGRGIDTVAFGSGRNILDLEDLSTANAVAANRVVVSGFDADGTAYSASSGTIDAIRFDDIASNADLSDGAVAADLQTLTSPANVTAAADDGIIELAFEFSPGVDLNAGGANELNGTTLLSACGALTGTTACTFTTDGNDEDLVIIAYQTSGGVTRAFIYHGNGAGGNAALVAGEIALIATVSGNVTVGGFDVSQFID